AVPLPPAEDARGLLRALADDVAAGGELDVLARVRLGQMRQDAALRDAAQTGQRQPNLSCHVSAPSQMPLNLPERGGVAVEATVARSSTRQPLDPVGDAGPARCRVVRRDGRAPGTARRRAAGRRADMVVARRLRPVT